MATLTRRAAQADWLIHRSDRGCPYTSFRYVARLADVSVMASVGSVADSYDNAMAEALNGTFKAELIHRRAGGSVTRSNTPCRVPGYLLSFDQYTSANRRQVDRPSPNPVRPTWPTWWGTFRCQVDSGVLVAMRRVISGWTRFVLFLVLPRPNHSGPELLRTVAGLGHRESRTIGQCFIFCRKLLSIFDWRFMTAVDIKENFEALQARVRAAGGLCSVQMGELRRLVEAGRLDDGPRRQIQSNLQQCRLGSTELTKSQDDWVLLYDLDSPFRDLMLAVRGGFERADEMLRGAIKSLAQQDPKLASGDREELDVLRATLDQIRALVGTS